MEEERFYKSVCLESFLRVALLPNRIVSYKYLNIIMWKFTPTLSLSPPPPLPKKKIIMQFSTLWQI